MHNTKLNLTIYLIILLATIGQITTDIYMPSLPAMAINFNYPINKLQFTVPLFTIGFSIGTLFYGPISDSLGRKPLILTSLIIGLLGSIICLSASDYIMLLIGRFIQGIGLGGAGSLSRAVTRDVSNNLLHMVKLNSIINILYATATAVAPVLGGYIEKYFFWRANFAILSIYILLIIIIIVFFFNETIQDKKKFHLSTTMTNFGNILTSKSFIFPCIAGSIGLAGLICYQTVAPFLLEEKAGLLPDEYGYMCIITILPLLIGGYLNNKLLNKYGSVKLIKIGLLCYLITGILYLFAYIINIFNVIVIIIPFLIFSLGCSFILPACSANSMMNTKESIGIASALYGCVQMVIVTISSYSLSLIHQPTLLSLSVCFILISALSIYLVKYIYTSKI